jgi:hypothetical protein
MRMTSLPSGVNTRAPLSSALPISLTLHPGYG